jgi:hypothetical protein
MPTNDVYISGSDIHDRWLNGGSKSDLLLTERNAKRKQAVNGGRCCEPITVDCFPIAFQTENTASFI